MKTITERYVIVWFPPDGDHEKKFSDHAAAVRFAERDDILQWNPIMERRVETIERTSTIVENWAERGRG